MANTLTVMDVYQIVNDVSKQAMGDGALRAVDTTTFLAVGETLLRTGYETTLNALSTVLARTIFSIRPYKAKLDILRATPERWGGQIRKVTYLYNDAEASQDWNTQLNPNQLANGNSIDMYKINAPEAVQLNFYGTKVLQKHITRFRDQLSLAFSSEQEFMRFVDGVMVEFFNEIEVQNESRTRATMLNLMGGISAMGLTVVDFIADFNTRQGTQYSRQQIFAEHMTQFMQFMAAQIKIYSKRLTDFSFKYHANLTGKKKIPRHTPRARQRMIMYDPIFIEAESMVYSTLFNPQYLGIGRFEGVNFWQTPEDPTAINVTPNILDVATGESKDGDNVQLPYVLGILFDEEAMGVIPQFDYASTTPFNSAGGYFNIYMHWRFNSFNDFTENAILFILGDGGAGTQDQTHVVIDNAPIPVVTSMGTEAEPYYVRGTQSDGSIPTTQVAGIGSIDAPTYVRTRSGQPLEVTSTARTADEPAESDEPAEAEEQVTTAKSRKK